MKLNIAILLLAGVVASAQNLWGEHENNMARRLAPTTAEEFSVTKNFDNVFLSAADISKILPHQYPFMLVDVVTYYKDGSTEANKRGSIVGAKAVTFNEPHFTGHYHDLPMMPEVLQLEALSQLAHIYLIEAGYIDDSKSSSAFVFVNAKVKWINSKLVVPGVTLWMEVNFETRRRNHKISNIEAHAWVNGEKVLSVGDVVNGAIMN